MLSLQITINFVSPRASSPLGSFMLGLWQHPAAALFQLLTTLLPETPAFTADASLIGGRPYCGCACSPCCAEQPLSATAMQVALIVAFVAAVTNGETPLNVLQLLWVNLIMDSLAALGEWAKGAHGRVLAVRSTGTLGSSRSLGLLSGISLLEGTFGSPRNECNVGLAGLVGWEAPAAEQHANGWLAAWRVQRWPRRPPRSTC